MKKNTKIDFYNRIVALLQEARKSVVRTVNKTMVFTYFEIGRIIVEEEQKGETRAKYGKQIIKELSQRLTQEFGKGFSTTNLKQMRQFYLTYSKSQTVSDQSETSVQKSITEKSEIVSNNFYTPDFQLSWSHYLFLMKIDNTDERKFYEIEAINNDWSLRELQRQFNTALYERLVLSRDTKSANELSKKGQIITKTEDTIKDPYILEFLGLPEQSKYSEKWKKAIKSIKNYT